MQPLALNLSRRPFRNNTLLWLLYSVAAVLLLVGSVWEVSSYYEYKSRLGAISEDVTSFADQTHELEQRDRVARKQIKSFDLPVLAGQVKKANDVIVRKAFSWTELFNQLEICLPHNVRMVTIRPEFGGGRSRSRGRGAADEELGYPVAVEAIAKNFPAVLAFQNELFASSHFGRVEMERTSKSDLGGNEYVVLARFMYFPDGNNAAIDEAGDTSYEEQE